MHIILQAGLTVRHGDTELTTNGGGKLRPGADRGGAKLNLASRHPHRVIQRKLPKLHDTEQKNAK